MTITHIENDRDIARAAELAFAAHRSLLEMHSFLPARTLDDYAVRIGWMVREGRVFGAFEDDRMAAFLGYFKIDNFRNAGPGGYSPDWCMGLAEGKESALFFRQLMRSLLADADETGLGIHAVSVYSSLGEIREEFSLTGYGGIVLDAARPVDALARDLADYRLAGKLQAECRSAGTVIRPATTADASRLASLDSALASHIGAAPVLMPDTHGSSADEWRDWLSSDERRALVAVCGGEIAGFIKAEEPQFDVSYAVHSPDTFAIDGLYVDPRFRGKGLARQLLASLADEARARGKSLMSVDCETMNPEAFRFWTRYFHPVSWSLERRW